MYTRIRIKNELCKWSLLIIIISSFTFAVALTFFSKSLETPAVYNVEIVDEDNTVLSDKAVKMVRELSGVVIVKSDADVKYVIKNGFMEKFEKGEFDGLIEVRKNSLKRGISLLNDRIVTRLVSDYIYLNLYDRMNKVKKISFEDYEKNLKKTRLANEILFIRVNDSRINDNIVSEMDFSSYIALFFLLTVYINIGMGRTIKLSRMRRLGILDRLRPAGAGEGIVIFGEFLTACILCIAATLPFIMFRYEIKIYIITVLLFFLNFIVNMLIERISKSEEILVFVLRSVMILFLGVGMFLNFYY